MAMIPIVRTIVRAPDQQSAANSSINIKTKSPKPAIVLEACEKKYLNRALIGRLLICMHAYPFFYTNSIIIISLQNYELHVYLIGFKRMEFHIKLISLCVNYSLRFSYI